MYDLIKEAIVDDDAAIELSKMDKNVVEVVDTTGAGDSFIGAFLFKLLD